MDEPIDKNITDEFIDGELDSDFEFALKLFDKFKEYIGELNDFDVAAFTENTEHIESLERLAHKTRSNCRLFGLLELEELTSGIERACQNKETNEALDYLKKLKQVSEKSLKIVRDHINERQKNG